MTGGDALYRFDITSVTKVVNFQCSNNTYVSSVYDKLEIHEYNGTLDNKSFFLAGDNTIKEFEAFPKRGFVKATTGIPITIHSDRSVKRVNRDLSETFMCERPAETNAVNYYQACLVIVHNNRSMNYVIDALSGDIYDGSEHLLKYD